jgi:uncharacterized protein (TIGR02246 family)
MKALLSLVCAGLTTCIAVSAFGLSGDLAGNIGALERLHALSTNFDAAVKEQNPAALAALFAEDGTWVTAQGVFAGPAAIEKSFADYFQRSPLTNQIFQTDQLNSLGDEAWSIGQWWRTVQSPGGLVFLSGYWSAIIVQEGEVWKFRMLMFTQASQLGPN